MQNTLINCFISIDRKSISQNLPLSNILDQIKNGNIMTDGIINQARIHGKGSKKYDDIKKSQLLNFAFNFSFHEYVVEENISSPTGLFYLDVDYIKTEDELNRIKENIAKLPFVVACWKSLSGNGLGFLVRVDGITSENYSVYKDYFKKYFNGNDILLGHSLDKNAFKTIQRTVLSKDENIYINYDAVPVKYDDILYFINQSSELNNTTLGILTGGKKNVEHLMSCSDNTIFNNHLFNNEFNNPTLGILKGLKDNVEHLMSCSDEKYSRLKFSNEDFYITSSDEAFIIHQEKVPVVKIYLPRGGKISQGERHNMFFIMAWKLIAINGKDREKDILNYLLYLREKHCENPETFTAEEVRTILSRAVKNFDPTKIKVRYKRVTFNSSAGFTAKEKQAIGARASAEFRRNKTIELFYKHYSSGITQKKLATLTGVNVRTVQRYWNVNEDGTISFRLKEKSAPDHIEQLMQTLPDDSMSLSATTYSMVIESMEETATNHESIYKEPNTFMGRISTATGTDYFGSYAKKKREPKPLTQEEMEWAESLNWDEILADESQPTETLSEPIVNEIPEFTADMFDDFE
jgi:hypothetical protein